MSIRGTVLFGALRLPLGSLGVVSPTAGACRAASYPPRVDRPDAACRAEFAAETDDELSVAPGDAIVIQAEVDGWFQVTRTSDGRRGLIPASYANAT